MKPPLASKTPEQPCPHCGYLLDRASDMEGTHTPSKGDVSLCIQCAQVNLFDGNLHLRKLTDKEMFELRMSDVWPEVERHQRAISQVHERTQTRVQYIVSNGVKRIVRQTRL